MKKQLMMLAVILLGIKAQAQQCKSDSTYMYNVKSGALYLSQKIYNTYNSSGLVVHALTKTWNLNTSAFEDASQVTYTYNLAGKPTQYILQTRNAGIWVNSTKVTNVYPANYGDTILTSTIYENWDNVNAVWKNNSIVTLSFNGPLNNSKPTEQIQSNWDAGTNAWVFYSKYMYAYNSNHQRNYYATQYWSTTYNAWVSQIKFVYHFDANGDIDTVNASIWNISNNVWQNSSISVNVNSSVVGQPISYTNWAWDNINLLYYPNDRNTYFWNSFGKQDSVIQEIHTGTIWEKSTRAIMTYDGNGNQTGYKAQSWNMTDWQDSWQLMSTFDAHNNQTSSHNQQWDAATNTWIELGKQEDYYTCTALTGINETILGSNVLVYPNPTAGMLFLNADCNVELTDLRGKLITKAQNINSLDLSNHASGMYLLLLTDNKGQVIQRSKIVKE